MKIPLKITSKTILLFIVVLLFNIAPLAPLENETKAYTAPGYNGTFVYYSFRDGASGIYRMDNGIETQILANPAPSGPVTWSPDGQYLYLTATSSGNGDIYRMRPDGTELTRLTTAPGSDYGPTISKDGTKLVFRSARDGTNEIYIMNTDGTEQTRVTNNSTTESNPEISPDNTKIAFYDTRYGTDEIFTINVDGSGEQRLTNNAVMDFAPKWSSDGTRIGYTSRPDGHNEVYVMDADGTNQTRLTISTANAPFGNWSITGETIYYLLDGDFYSMDAYGNNKVKILEDSEHPELQPFMSIVGPSPDGRYLVFESSALISPTIYTLNLMDLSISQIVDTPWSGAQGAGFQPILNTPPVLATKTTALQSGTSRLVDVLAGATDEEALDGSNIAITGAPAHGNASVEAGKVRYAADSGYVGVDSVEYEVCDSFLLDQKCSTKTLGITVTPALGVAKINGDNYDAGVAGYTTPSLRPTFSGTATPGSEIAVEIHSDPIILTTTADGNGNWSVTPTFDLPSGEHIIYISATLGGIRTELTAFGLTIGILAKTGTPVLPLLVGGAGSLLIGITIVLKRKPIQKRSCRMKKLNIRSFKKLTTATTALGVAITSLLVTPLPADAAFPGYNGKVAIWGGDDYQVYLANSHTDPNPIKVTNVGSVNYALNWSPDGNTLLFTSNRDGNYEIYSMDVDGSNQTNLTNSVGNDTSPIYSPDGMKIAFISTRDGDKELFVMDADGQNQVQLTSNATLDELWADYAPRAWSPDGSKIVFHSKMDGNTFEIYTVNVDGSGLTRLTNNDIDDKYPNWSPDGTSIAYMSETDGAHHYDIFTMDTDGDNKTNLTNTVNVSEWYPNWSPDGNKIAFVSWTYDADINGRTEIINKDGQNRSTVTDDAIYGDHEDYYVELATWSPDGKKLAITLASPDFTEYKQYTVDVDGSNLQWIFQSVDQGSYITWQPRLNQPPIIANDSATISFNTPKLIDVLANDTDEEAFLGSNLSISIQPLHGSVSIVGGKVRYTPTNGYIGGDVLAYQICDAFTLDQKCNTGTLSLTILAPGTPSISVATINGEPFDPEKTTYTTTSLRPTFSGTATPGAGITVEIHSDPIVLSTLADGNGHWSITPTFDLPTGEHIVYVSATLNGITTEIGVFRLTVRESLANTGVAMWFVVALPIVAIATGTSLLTSRLKKLPHYGN